MMKNLNLYVINGMYWITAAVFLPYIGAYYTSIGMSESQVGVLAAIIPLASLVIQPIWAYISDKTEKRKEVLLFLCIGCAISILVFLHADTFYKCLVGILLYASFASALLPLCDALVIKTAERRNADFSYIRMCGTVSYAVVVFFIGRLLNDNYRIIFWVSSFSFLLFMVCCATLKNDEGEKNIKLQKSARMRQERHTKGRIFKSRQVIVILLCAFAMQLGLNYHATFISVYLVSLGYGNETIGIMSCISALSEVPILLVISKIRKRFPIVPMLAATIVLCALRLLLVSSGNIILMMTAQLLQGPTYMICYFSCVMYINEQVMEGQISQGQSMLAVVQGGLGCIFGSLFGGMLAEKLGMQKGFWIVGGLIILLSVSALIINQFIIHKEVGENALCKL